MEPESTGSLSFNNKEKMKNVVLALFVLTIGTANAQDLLLVSQEQFKNECTPDPNERAVTSNASSDPNCNESDSTAGWNVYSGAVTISSEETNVHDGNSKIVLTNPGTASTSAIYQVPGPITSGDTFTVRYWIRSNGANDARVAAWTGCTGLTVRYATSTWTYYQENITATAGYIGLKFYPYAGGAGPPAAGDTIEIDGLSVLKTN